MKINPWLYLAGAVLCLVLALSEARSQTNLTTANAPSFPIVQPQGGCAQGHFLGWLDQNWCLAANGFSIISVDPSSLLIITSGGTVAAGHTVTLNVIYGGNTYPSSYTTVAGDTPTKVASGLVAAIIANANVYTAPAGGLPGPILFITNSLDGGITFTPTISLDFDSRVNVKLSWSSTGAETLSYDAACGTTGCPVVLDNAPVIACGRLVGTAAPPPGSVICAFQMVGAQSSNPNVLSVQYLSFGVSIRSSVSGSLASCAFFIVPDNNGVQNKGVYDCPEGFYPVADNTSWSGHQGFRWSTVWSYVGDFATGLTVANKPGLNVTKTVRNAANTGSCTLIFTGGLLTGGTC